MISEEKQQEVSVATRYRVRVRGTLTEQMAEAFGEMSVHRETNGLGPITILEGPFRDQAALMGCLNALYSWRHLLLAVHCLEDSESPSP